MTTTASAQPTATPIHSLIRGKSVPAFYFLHPVMPFFSLTICTHLAYFYVFLRQIFEFSYKNIPIQKKNAPRHENGVNKQSSGFFSFESRRRGIHPTEQPFLLIKKIQKNHTKKENVWLPFDIRRIPGRIRVPRNFGRPNLDNAEANVGRRHSAAATRHFPVHVRSVGELVGSHCAAATIRRLRHSQLANAQKQVQQKKAIQMADQQILAFLQIFK